MSFSERAGITAPLMLAPMPRRLEARVHAAQERAVAVEREPEARVACGRRCSSPVALAAASATPGTWSPGQTELAVAGRAQQVELTAFLADEHVRAGDVRAACEVEADERNLARAVLMPQPSRFASICKSVASARERRARIREQAQEAAVDSTVAPPVMKP